VHVLGVSSRVLLTAGLGVCVLGGVFGLVIYSRLKRLAVHRSMRDVSELIYETCKTYLVTQGRFLLLLELFIGTIMLVYFGWLRNMDAPKVAIILLFSLIGMAGSYGVAWFGIRVNTFGQLARCLRQPARRTLSHLLHTAAGGHEHRHLAHLHRAGDDALHPAVHPCRLRRPCFIGFAIGESLGASVLRIAGGIFTKIADIGSDLMKIIFNIKEDDARNPGVIADCTGDNAGDSVGPRPTASRPTASPASPSSPFIILAVSDPTVAGAAVGVDLRHAHHDDRHQRCLLRYQPAHRAPPLSRRPAHEFRDAAHRPRLAHLDHLDRRYLPRLLLMIPELGGDVTLWWKLFDHHQLWHVGRRRHPRGGQGLHLHQLQARARGGVFGA